MVGQCPECKGYFGIQQEWIGQQAQCPHCQLTIMVQAVETSGVDLSTKTVKTSHLELWLLIVGIINFCSGFLHLIGCKIQGFDFYESSFFKLWTNGLCLLVPAIGCIVSIFYFKINNNKCKKIQWEYIGIVTSFISVISFLINKLFFSVLFFE